MKILYAVQGTGNGHVARAREIVPLLQKDHTVDVLISGIQAEVDLPFPVKYRCYGLSFIFGKKGGVDILGTYKKAKIKRLLKDIKSLPVAEYDLVLNDFEPVSAWACYFAGKPCISLSHQAAVLNKKAPQPKNADPIGKAVLKTYAPVTAQYAFHFKAYDENIFTPVIRSEIRKKTPSNMGHYTVYLPAYSDEKILKLLRRFNVRWEVFSKHSKKTYREKNILVRPINNEAFIESMVSSTGVLCGAGFETPAEALFLRKKLLVIPMQGQYEQQCNAAALKKMDVPVIKKLKLKHLPKLQAWIKSSERVEVNYPDITQEILNKVIGEHAAPAPAAVKESVPAMKSFRKNMFKKILSKTAV